MTAKAAQAGKKSEIVRQRRSQQINKRTEHKLKQAQTISTPQNAPIFVRRGVVGTPVIQRTRSNVRRKYTLPMKNGSEMLMPALPIKNPGWRLLSGFIAISMLVFLFMTSFTSLFYVKGLAVSGLQRLNPTDLTGVLRLQNTPIYAVDPQAVRQQLEAAFPELYDIQVSVEFPANLLITAGERQPLLAWHYGSLTSWIDKDGNIFPARGLSDGLLSIYADDAPPRTKIPMTEDEMEAQADDTDAEENDRMIRLIDGPVDPLFIQEVLDLQQRMPEITQLSYNARDGFGWHDDANNWNLYFGHRLDMLDQKLLLYARIKNMVHEQGLNPELISVAYIRAPFLRVE